MTHYRDMLHLNPNDNQGIRYLLLDCLLILGRDDDATKLMPVNRYSAAARTTIRFKTARTRSSDRRLVLTSSLYRPVAENAP